MIQMIEINMELTNDEYGEFMNLLDDCINFGEHILDDRIAEKIARKIEEGVE